jgi:hypothetical protein
MWRRYLVVKVVARNTAQNIAQIRHGECPRWVHEAAISASAHDERFAGSAAVASTVPTGPRELTDGERNHEMNLPIDTQKVRFLVSRPPKPVTDWDSGQHAVNSEGLPYFHVELVAMADGSGAEVIKVRVPGEPQGLIQHSLVKVTGLRAKPWVNKERGSAGVAYFADRIETEVTGRA